jgi:antitoxin MazE
MTTTIQKWGNSLALRIPKSFAKDIHLGQGAEVVLSIQKGRLVVEPLPQTKHKLTDLLKGITPQNSHAETKTGRPTGKEVW